MQLKINQSFHKTTSRGTKQEQAIKSGKQVIKKINHMERVFENLNDKYALSKIAADLSSFNGIYKPNLDKNYIDWFNEIIQPSINRFNAKQTRNDRKIYGSGFQYFTESGNDYNVGHEIIFSFGNLDTIGSINKQLLEKFKAENTPQKLQEYLTFWHDFNIKFAKKFAAIFEGFQVFESVVHLDESTPHLHCLGNVFEERKNAKNGLDITVASRRVFSRENLTKGHQILRQWLQKKVMPKFNQLIAKYGYDEVNFSVNLENKINTENIKQPNIKNKKIANALLEIETDENCQTKSDQNSLLARLLNLAINNNDSNFKKDLASKLNALNFWENYEIVDINDYHALKSENDKNKKEIAKAQQVEKEVINVVDLLEDDLFNLENWLLKNLDINEKELKKIKAGDDTVALIFKNQKFRER